MQFTQLDLCPGEKTAHLRSLSSQEETKPSEHRPVGQVLKVTAGHLRGKKMSLKPQNPAA